MCRSMDYQQYMERKSLKIKAFFVRFTGLTTTREFLPDSLTLLYPPRINEAALELGGSKIRPDSPAYVTLHRLVREGRVVYGSREGVRVWEGVRVEVYMREDKVIRGIFRKDEGHNWKLECHCEMEGEGAAEVLVAVEGHVAMCERLAMVTRRRNLMIMRRKRKGLDRLEEIPEEREEERESDGGCCCACGGSVIGDEGERGTEEIDFEIEGLSWAVDLGIWVMCLGVGYLVSKASSMSSSRRRKPVFF